MVVASLLLNLEFLKSLPSIFISLIRLVFEIKKLIDIESEERKRKGRLDEFIDTIKKARETGDTTDLEYFMRSLGT